MLRIAYIGNGRGLFLACHQDRRFASDFLTAQKVVPSGLLGEARS